MICHAFRSRSAIDGPSQPASSGAPHRARPSRSTDPAKVCEGATPMSSSWLLIEHGTVIDGDANPPIPDTPVLIRDHLIHAVGPGADRSAVPTGEKLTVIDAAGRTV